MASPLATSYLSGVTERLMFALRTATAASDEADVPDAEPMLADSLLSKAASQPAVMLN